MCKIFKQRHLYSDTNRTKVAKSFQVIGFDFPVEGPLADAEDLGGAAAVAAVLEEGGFDGRALDVRHGHA
jgi:hypothetical protein